MKLIYIKEKRVEIKEKVVFYDSEECIFKW